MTIHYGEDGKITSDIAPGRMPAPHVDTDKVGELHHDESAVRESQTRASGKGAAWARRGRGGYRAGRPL